MERVLHPPVYDACAACFRILRSPTPDNYLPRCLSKNRAISSNASFVSGALTSR